MDGGVRGEEPNQLEGAKKNGEILSRNKSLVTDKIWDSKCPGV